MKELRTEWGKVAQKDRLDAKLVAVCSNSLNQEEFCQIKTQNWSLSWFMIRTSFLMPGFETLPSGWVESNKPYSDSCQLQTVVLLVKSQDFVSKLYSIFNNFFVNYGLFKACINPVSTADFSLSGPNNFKSCKYPFFTYHHTPEESKTFGNNLKWTWVLLSSKQPP